MYESNYGTAAAVSIVGGFVFLVWFICIIINLFSIICTWIVYKKANKPGWASIIPVYCNIVLLEIAELPLWYIILFFLPVANIYAIFKMYIELAKRFGKSELFGVGLVFFTPIFMAILAFDNESVYTPTSKVGSSSFCTHCGKSVEKEAKFCKSCGNQL